ncbi:MAG: hypothetical protein HQ546_10000 [Planctomycetes bacterium]|nr:hypothetical protein [Planctomycetota bacterium]
MTKTDIWSRRCVQLPRRSASRTTGWALHGHPPITTMAGWRSSIQRAPRPVIYYFSTAIVLL